MEARSQQPWHRCSSTEMVSQKSICIPSICLDSQSTEKGRGGESAFSNNSNSNYGVPKFIWDVQLVLDYLKNELSNNSDSSDKLLTFKVAMLLALTSASRVRGLHILDTRFMVKTSQKYVFKFHKLHKSWIQGQKPTTLEFVGFSQDKDLCCVTFG